MCRVRENGNNEGGINLEIKFVCSLPDIQSTLNFGGDRARIKIDIPETDIAQAAKLIMARGKVINVTMEWEDAC